MKRILVFSAISVVLLVTAGLVYFFWIEGQSKIVSPAIRAIPIDAGIIVRSDSFEELSRKIRKENQLWAVTKSFSLISEADRILTWVDSVKAISESFNQLVYSNPIFLSVHPIGKGEPCILLAANIPKGVSISDIIGLTNQLTESQFKLSEKKYNNVTIYSFTGSNSEKIPELSLAIHQNVIVVSTSLLLVESAIGQLGSSTSLVEDKYFTSIQKTAGSRVDANVYINHSKINSIFKQQVNENYRHGFVSLSDVSLWSELDLILKPDAISLNGFSQVSDSLNTFYRVFLKQKPIQSKLTTIIPAQTAAFSFIGISDINSYLQQYESYLHGNSRIRQYQQQLNDLNKKLGINVKDFYASFFKEELALVFIPFEGESYDECLYVVAGTKGKSQAKQMFLSVIEDFAQKNRQSVKSFQREYKIDREKTAEIYRFPSSGIHSALFGSLFEDVNDSFFTFIDSYIVFGSSVESLSRLILANVHNKQLSADNSFVQFSQLLSPESNFTQYINPSKADMLVGKFLTPSIASRLLARNPTLQKFQGIAIQLSSGRGMVFNNVCARYSPFSSDDPQTVWETRLDTLFSMKPQLVINHITQQREIFVQDEQNAIYLINDIGRVLWKKPLSEPIIGEVSQIDIYRNGKLQLIFNTRSNLYIVDRNGNNVDGFPVKLRSAATNPVSVFDYEGNRDYRFFIAGEDRAIYAYDKNGNVIPGWDFEKTEKIVVKPLQHFRVSSRDYIVFADENRPYILNRRGNERVKLSRYFSQAPNSTFVLEENSSRNPPRLVTTDTLGLVRYIYFDGRVDEKAVKTVSKHHAFDYQDVDADGLKDFIFIDGNKLYVFRNNGKELFSQKFDEDLYPKSIYFHFGGRDRKLGVVSNKTAEIFLINGDGKLYKGFPLKGVTPFSIGQFASTKSKFNLVVGSTTGFVLNYAVQ